MQAILKINDGGNVRDAVPLRAIPYVTFWKDSPDGIVSTLAAPKTGLFAYQMDAQGHFEQVPPEQWESWVVTLNCLTLKYQADERDGAEQENHASWRIKAILELPDNVFVWLDEFQRWHSRTRPLAVSEDYWNDCLKWESNHERLLAKLRDPSSELSELEWAILDEPDPGLEQESDRLCLTPIVPPEIENKMWRYSEGNPQIEQVREKIPGKLPSRSVAKLAIEAAWQIECKTKRRASAKEVMTQLQAWADAGEKSDILIKSLPVKRAVQWLTARVEHREYTTEACQETLNKWNKSRQ